MILRLVSDLHLEFSERPAPMRDDLFESLLPPLETDEETILLLPGDIGLVADPHYQMLEEFLLHCSFRFKKVLYIPGNHEYYRSEWHETKKMLTAMVESISNIVSNVRYGETLTFALHDEKVAIIMATLWTDMNRENPLSMVNCQVGLSDYRVVQYNNRVLLPADTVAEFRRHKEFVFNSIVEYGEKGYRTIVATHHAPSSLSNTGFEGSPIKDGFYSSLEEDIFRLNTPPILWIHGHMHGSYDYMLDTTRVLCNPRGYPGSDLNLEFNPGLVIKV